MNITGIKWEQGKRYDVHVDFGTYVNIYKTIVDMGDLIIVNEGKSIFDTVQPQYLIGGMTNFEEVIESVDFLTAYKDCKENGAIYTRNDTRENHCDMENLEGEVMIINTASRSTNLSEFEWKKVSK